MATEWANNIAFNFGTHCHVGDGLRNRGPRHLILKDILGSFIKCRTLCLCWQNLGFLHQGTELFVAPLCAIGFLNTVTAQQNSQEMIWITVVTRPTQQNRIVAVLGFGAFKALSPSRKI